MESPKMSVSKPYQRKHDRQTCSLLAEYVPEALECPQRSRRWFPAVSVDLSPGGIRLWSFHGPETNDRVKVRLRQKHGGEYFVIQARVVHVGPAPGHGWISGCEFFDGQLATVH